MHSKKRSQWVRTYFEMPHGNADTRNGNMTNRATLTTTPPNGQDSVSREFLVVKVLVTVLRVLLLVFGSSTNNAQGEQYGRERLTARGRIGSTSPAPELQSFYRVIPRAGASRALADETALFTGPRPPGAPVVRRW